MTRGISVRKCEIIFRDLKVEHCEYRKAGDSDIMGTFYKSSAREIEAHLYDMELNGDINSKEHRYIFGMICQDALHCGGTDFYR